MSLLPEPIKAITGFTLIAGIDGTIEIYTEDVPSYEKMRNATLDDLEMYASHLALSANRAQLVLALTPETEKTTAEKVSVALAKRNRSRRKT